MFPESQGEEQWVSKLESKFLAEFSETPAAPWTTLDSGTLAGVVRSAGGGGRTAGNVTFVTVHEAGFVYFLLYESETNVCAL